MSNSVLPDVASHSKSTNPAPLRWVGMEQIAVPISIVAQNGSEQNQAAKANVYVNLEQADVKGIHMSRLYSAINQLSEIKCNHQNVHALLEEIIQSQNGISNAAKIELTFELLLKRKALLSDHFGFQSYPISITAQKIGSQIQYQLELKIAYSSTCPCSASLSEQLYANAIGNSFPEGSIDKAALIDWVQKQAGSVATPHSQRSYMLVKLVFGDHDWPNIENIISQLEATISTPVQTAVKRKDEQEFARLNAENLMFCEDAARRVKAALEDMSLFSSYWLKIEHQESLHGHNAVVVDYSENYQNP